jgi:hypothetical protein
VADPRLVAVERGAALPSTTGDIDRLQNPIKKMIFIFNKEWYSAMRAAGNGLVV